MVAAGEFVKTLPVEARYFVEDWPGSEDWYIYRGEILPQWIKEIERWRSIQRMIEVGENLALLIYFAIWSEVVKGEISLCRFCLF